MPITMQFGPISAALSLAQKAGAGQGFAEQRTADQRAQQLAQQAQDELDRNNATMIQDSMQQQQEQNRQQQTAGQAALQAAQFRSSQALRQQQEQNQALQIQQQGAYQQGQLGIQKENAQTRQQSTQNTADYHQGELGNQQAALENKADDMMLRSQTNQFNSVQSSLKAAEAQYAKVMGNPLSSDEDVKQMKAIVDSLKGQLTDTTDPSTGQPTPGLGTAIKISQARIAKRAQQQPQIPVQQQNQALAPGSFNYQGTLRPAGQPAPAQPAPSSFATQITPESTGGLAPPELYKPLFAGVAAQLKLPQNDPKVVEAVKQQLHAFGYTGMIPSQ